MVKKCVECDIEKDINSFYKYNKTNKFHSKCKDCFNRKEKCEYCDKMLNRSFMKRHCKQNHSRSELEPEVRHSQRELESLIPHSRSELEPELECNRTLIIGPSFSGKTFLMKNKLRLINIDYPDKDIKIVTRSPKQYLQSKLEPEIRHSQSELEPEVRHSQRELESSIPHLQSKLESVSPYEEDFDCSEEVESLENYQNCVIVFDDMLDSNQKLIDPFFTRGRHENIDVYYLSQRYFELPIIIRDNSNIIILFKQTAKTVQSLYNDIAGFDMSYEEFKNLCREVWKNEFNYLKIERHKNRQERYSIWNESNPQYKVFKPATEPF